jgi:DNA-binding transcriptional ArsR family regulator
MNYISFDDFFSVLGNKQRVKILQLLDRKGPMNVSSIASELQIEQSAVSHSISRLLKCHFVTLHPSGKERIYAINEDTIKPLFKLIGVHVKQYCYKGCEHWQ